MSITTDIQLGKYARKSDGKVVFVLEILPPDPRYKHEFPVLKVRTLRGAYHETRKRSAERFLNQYRKVEE
jgi:hypothetical protein